jgi:hypothetical protein
MRQARKRHVCCECDRTIEPGERYELYTLLFEGKWEEFKTCLGCLRIANHLAPHGRLIGELAEQVAECIGFNYVTGEEVRV